MDQEFAELVKLKVGDESFEFSFIPYKNYWLILSVFNTVAFFGILWGAYTHRLQDLLLLIALALVNLLAWVACSAEFTIRNGLLLRVYSDEFSSTTTEMTLSMLLSEYPHISIERLMRKLEKAERRAYRKRMREAQARARQETFVAVTVARETARAEEASRMLAVEQEVGRNVQRFRGSESA